MHETRTASVRFPRIEDWPPLHRRAWEAAFAAGGLFDASGAATRWRTASARKTRLGYAAWLHWRFHWRLSQKDADAAKIEASRPEDLVSREAVLAYVEHLTSLRSSMTVFNRIQELYDAIRVMAPARDWTWLKMAQRNLRSRAKPEKDKLARLQSADRLEDLGFSLMAEAETAAYWKDEDGPAMTLLQRALAFRDGLMIALLIRRPFRIKNFVSLGKSLLYDGEAARFAFPASETKSKRPVDAAFPKPLMSALKRYVDTYRPILLSESGKAKGLVTDALWISRDGTELVEVSLHNAIRRRTREAFGAPIPPHWFRDAAVTFLVRDEPASARLAGSILGHSSPEIANRHYNQALMIDSARRHVSVIESLIDPRPSRAPKRKRPSACAPSSTPAIPPTCSERPR
jgi:integrase/recombinase XerD